MALLIDIREKDPMLVDSVISIAIEKGHEYRIAKLEVGDFVWEESSICIEHKSTKDFLSSIVSGHLYSQMRDMHQYERPFLFIEGEWPFRQKFGRTFLTQKIVAGLLSQVLFHFPAIQTVYWPSDTMFAQAVVSLRNRADEKGPLVDVVKRTPSKTVYEDPNLAGFLSIPGIGEKKAKDLISMYGNFWCFIDTFKNEPEAFHLRGNTLPKKAFAYMEGITK